MAKRDMINQVRQVLEKPIPGICLSLAIGGIASVIIAMMHDARWLLVVPWVCVIVLFWEFARAFKQTRIVAARVAAVSSILCGVLIFFLYDALAPSEEDTQVAFDFSNAQTDQRTLALSVRNKGPEASILHQVGLLRIAAKPAIGREPAGLAKCDFIDPGSLLMLDLIHRLFGNRLQVADRSMK